MSCSGVDGCGFRGVAVMVMALVVCLCVAGSAWAQPRMGSGPPLPSIPTGSWFGDPDGDPVMVNAHVGLGGRSFSTRWTPMRLTIVSTSAEGYGGVVRVRTTIDGEVRSYDVPFALQPGGVGWTGGHRRDSTTVFVGFVSADLFPERYAIEFEVLGRPLGSEGRAALLQRGVFENSGRAGVLPVPDRRERFDPVVLQIGECSVARAVMRSRASDRALPSYGFSSGTNNVEIVRAEAHDLPFPASRWMLYDGFDSVVLAGDGLARMSDGQREALLRWVEFGGHVVLIDDLLGISARGFVPEGVLTATIVGEADGMAGDGERLGRISIAPTRDGARVGWDSLALDGLPAGTAASGPVGLGRVTVLAFDPGSRVEPEGVDAAWRRALDIDRVVAVRDSMEMKQQDRYRHGGVIGSEFVGRSLDHAATVLGVRPIPAWMIGLLVVGIGLLVAVGTTFVDWFALGTARRRRLSFLTAIGWLVMGSLIALFLPMVLRAGETSAVRIQVIDVNEANGSVACSEVFALSAGRRLRFVPAGQAPEAWTRPVSAAQRSSPMLLSTPSEQFAGNMVSASSASLWTFHGAIGESAGSVPGLEGGALPIGARIELDPVTGDAMLVIRNGLGELAGRSVFVAFKRGESAIESNQGSGIVSLLVPVPTEEAGLDSHRIPLRSGEPALGLHDGFWTRADSGGETNRSRDRTAPQPVLLSELPGVALRNAGVHAALGSGRYAAVTMKIDRASDEIAAQDDAAFVSATEPPGLIERGVMHRWVRVLVPIDESTREALVDLHDGGLGRRSVEGAQP